MLRSVKSVKSLFEFRKKSKPTNPDDDSHNKYNYSDNYDDLNNDCNNNTNNGHLKCQQPDPPNWDYHNYSTIQTLTPPSSPPPHPPALQQSYNDYLVRFRPGTNSLYVTKILQHMGIFQGATWRQEENTHTQHLAPSVEITMVVQSVHYLQSLACVERIIRLHRR